MAQQYGFKSVDGSQLLVLFCFQHFVCLENSGTVAATSIQAMPAVGMHNIEARRGSDVERDLKVSQFMSVADVHDIDLANELVYAISSL
jgi:hypothetical protein